MKRFSCIIRCIKAIPVVAYLAERTGAQIGYLNMFHTVNPVVADMIVLFIISGKIVFVIVP